MHDDELIRMANQIADYFKAYPREEAVPGIATHIRKFWEPRMRRRLLAISADAAEKLHPLAREALPLIPVPAA
jgi:formate dehydrogenase subunit delta